MAAVASQVGGFILMHKEDLKRMAPLWLKYSEDVRFDPDVRLHSFCSIQSGIMAMHAVSAAS